MRTISYTILALLTVAPAVHAEDWRQFRGTRGDSVSRESTPLPATFADDAKDANVAWKIDLPGRGPSSPIVVGDRVIVTASSGARGDRLHVICFDAATGRERWHRQLWATGHTTVHPFGANAAPTPACDGERIFAFYSSNDLACFDMDGNLQWFRGFAYEHPTTRNDVGMSSSPLVADGVVIVQLENQGDSFVAAVDKETGKTKWRVDRDRDAMWSSPVLLDGARPLVLVQGRDRLAAYDVASGEEVCDFEASCHTIGSVTPHGNRAYLPAKGLNALEFDPVKKTVELAWHEQKLNSGNASPIVHDGRCYAIKNPGILACGDAKTGEVLWQLRLKGPFWATPVLADNRLWCVSHKGLVQIVELGEEAGKVAASVQLDPGILASPAVADGAIYFRSDGHLWKVANGGE